MGRYYCTSNGEFDGKFWFGLQGSDEPGWVFGLAGDESEDGGEIDYYATDDDIERIMRVLDHQYSVLKVNKYRRRYNFDNGQQIGEYVWGELKGTFLCDKMKVGANRVEQIPYSTDDGKHKYVISEQRVRAASRLDLGLRILNDIRKHGECNLAAEL